MTWAPPIIIITLLTQRLLGVALTWSQVAVHDVGHPAVPGTPALRETDLDAARSRGAVASTGSGADAGSHYETRNRRQTMWCVGVPINIGHVEGLHVMYMV